MTCGYCHEEKCICDGFGNDPKTGLPLDYSKGMPDTYQNSDEWPAEETELTWEDGTPYVPTRERHIRTDYRSPERAWRPQRPRY
jgi:hypothetical protein